VTCARFFSKPIRSAGKEKAMITQTKKTKVVDFAAWKAAHQGAIRKPRLPSNVNVYVGDRRKAAPSNVNVYVGDRDTLPKKGRTHGKLSTN